MGKPETVSHREPIGDGLLRDTNYQLLQVQSAVGIGRFGDGPLKLIFIFNIAF